MVRLEIAGQPVLDVSAGGLLGESSSLPFRSRTRRRITSTNESVHFNWRSSQPRLVVTSDTDEFDPTVFAHLQEEGFQIWYLPYAGGHSAYNTQLQKLADPLDLGEEYAIIAYGDAAALCLEACMKPMPKLCALVAFYPPYMPHTSTNFPPSLQVQIHLAGSQKFGTRFPSSRYPGVDAGFAESDLEEYDTTAATLAWSRMLALLRKAFSMDVESDFEKICDTNTRLKFQTNDTDAESIMKTMVSDSNVNNAPTMTGGSGTKELRKFYGKFFKAGNPKDLRVRLLSRTVGANRVVDEMLITFTHTCEMPWMLPGVPPTDKAVEVVVVSIVTIRGGKLVQEHLHWDQATVLVQIGLLDPKYVPSGFTTTEKDKAEEVERLPVVGKEAARQIVNQKQGKLNGLIPDWRG